MNDIVPPVYAALACVFGGLMLGNLAQHQSRMGAVGAGLAALACLCVAALPFVGRPGLVFGTALVLCSLAALGLRVRSWRQPLQRRQITLTFGVVVLASLLNMLLVLGGAAVQLRVSYQGLLSNGMVLYVLYGLWQLQSPRRSVQLRMMWVALPVMMTLFSFWTWVVYEQLLHGGVVMFRTNLNEPWLAFVLRLFVVGALILAHVGAQGYELEREVELQERTSSEKLQAESLNQQLQQLLNEKNEMLQALSFAARSQNLPAIMSSLAHEINQPLGAIRLNADYLLSEDARLIPLERTQLLQQLVAGSMTATQVVRDFRRFLEANLTPHVPVDLSLLVTDMVRGYQAEFGRQQVQVSLQDAPAVSVQGDPVQLEAALVGSLLYMLQRDRHSRRQMKISTVQIGRFVHLRMLDNGQPITNAQFELALDRMGQDSAQHFSQSLWLSRAIIEHHGGAMNVHAEEGRTGISLQLPVLEEAS